MLQGQFGMIHMKYFLLTMMTVSYFKSFYYGKTCPFPFAENIICITTNSNCFSFKNTNFKKTIAIHPHDGSLDSGGCKLPPRLYYKMQVLLDTAAPLPFNTRTCALLAQVSVSLCYEKPSGNKQVIQHISSDTSQFSFYGI